MGTRSRRKLKSSSKVNNLIIFSSGILAVFLIILISQVAAFYEGGNVLNVPASSSGEMVIVPVEELYHVHSDFKVVLNGEEVDFNKEKFSEANRFMHIHIGNPNGDRVIHVHLREDTTMGFFFSSMGMRFDSDCFVLDGGERFCNGEEKLKFFVNGGENFEFGNYVPKDLDRMLVTFGSGDVDAEMNSVSSYACVSSGNCKEEVPETSL